MPQTFNNVLTCVICRPSGALLHSVSVFPGLTPWAILLRPSGALVYCMNNPD